MSVLKRYKTCPPGFKRVDDNPLAEHCYRSRDGLLVITSGPQEYGDGRTYVHVSLSRKNRMPSYEDMARVKALFVGPDCWAYQVFPTASQHVNIHNRCLHLWCPVDGPVLPDFTMGHGTI